jgi:hypothetical protein
MAITSHICLLDSDRLLPESATHFPLVSLFILEDTMIDMFVSQHPINIFELCNGFNCWKPLILSSDELATQLLHSTAMSVSIFINSPPLDTGIGSFLEHFYQSNDV